MLKPPSSHRQPPAAGFSLIELMIVIAVIGIVSAMAIPQLQAARITANEASAMATLRAIAAAQAQTMAIGTIDTNGDGAGEYAYLAELAGTVPLRASQAGQPAPGLGGIDELRPPSLPVSLGIVQNGIGQHSGYFFQIWLPGERQAGVVPGVPEDANGGKLAAPWPDPIESTIRWCAYAWPISYTTTGVPTFFISSEGELMRYANRGAVRYQGLAGGPNFDAAYTAEGDMSSPTARQGLPGADGNVWTLLQ